MPPDTPLILVTNDDGVRAPGLRALVEALSDIGRVVVVAPEGPRSAVSHSITLHKPLRLWESQPGWYVCSGSPVDCVYLGVHAVCTEERPQIVVSGINRGANLGNDVFYSGTVAGAMEGLLTGLQAMAVSQKVSVEREFDFRGGLEIDYSRAAELSARLAAKLFEHGLPRDTLLNVNVPPNYDPAMGVRVATLGRRIYDQGAIRGVDPRGRPYYWIGGSDSGHEDIPGSDCVLLEQGFATVTAVLADMTDKPTLERLEQWNLS